MKPANSMTDIMIESAAEKAMLTQRIGELEAEVAYLKRCMQRAKNMGVPIVSIMIDELKKGVNHE